eukprot:3287597-Lingulodinium_polyedra.AAC.1
MRSQPTDTQTSPKRNWVRRAWAARMARTSGNLRPRLCLCQRTTPTAGSMHLPTTGSAKARIRCPRRCLCRRTTPTAGSVHLATTGSTNPRMTGSRRPRTSGSSKSTTARPMPTMTMRCWSER